MTDRLRELEKAATPAPWHRHTYGHDSLNSQVKTVRKSLRMTNDALGYPKGVYAQTDLTWLHADGDDGEGATIAMAGNGPLQIENAALVAAMRNALPLLLDVVDAADRYLHAPGPWPEEVKARKDALHAALAALDAAQ